MNNNAINPIFKHEIYCFYLPRVFFNGNSILLVKLGFKDVIKSF